jgi:hypothetical protein
MPETPASNRAVPTVPPEESGKRMVAAFFTEYFSSVEKDFEQLRIGSNEPLRLSLPEFQIEVLILALHCLDRAAFAYYGAEYRSAFMDSAVSFTVELMTDGIPEDRRTEFAAGFRKHYNEQQASYGALMFPATDELKGTLFWEFGKRICEQSGVYNPVTVFEMAHAGSGMFEVLAETLLRTA